MTWEDVITEANKAIEQLQIFIAEDAKNDKFYQEKLAAMMYIKQEALIQQNRTIQATLGKIGQEV